MVILKNRKRMKRTLLSLFLLGTIFMGLCATSIAASTTYEVALNKGTVTFMVNHYNEGKWENTVDDELGPDDWFGGDSDDIGAKAKLTIRYVDSYKWDLFEVLISIFDVMSFIPDDLSINDTLLIMAYFSEDSIDDLFPDKYEVWEALTVKWDYTTDGFDEEPDETENLLPIFKDPKDYKDILEDYNRWVLSINFTMVSLGLEPYAILDGDDFLWQLIISGIFTIARPFNTYLKTLINELDCNDVEVKDNTLIMEKKGEEDYTVEVTFSDQGIQSTFIIKNDDDRIIYEIINDDTDFIVLIVLGVMATAIAGIVYVAVIIRKKNREI